MITAFILEKYWKVSTTENFLVNQSEQSVLMPNVSKSISKFISKN